MDSTRDLLQLFYDVSNVDVKLRLIRLFPNLCRNKIHVKFNEINSIHCNKNLLKIRQPTSYSALILEKLTKENTIKVVKFDNVIITEIEGKFGVKQYLTRY